MFPERCYRGAIIWKGKEFQRIINTKMWKFIMSNKLVLIGLVAYVVVLFFDIESSVQMKVRTKCV